MNEEICECCNAPVNEEGEYINLVKRLDPGDPAQRKLTEWLGIE